MIDIRPQYHGRLVDGQIHVWNVKTLLIGAKDIAVSTVSLSQIGEIDERYWYDFGNESPTCRGVLEHAQLINNADLKWPILLCSNGRVMDGMHRVMKAVGLGHDTIQTVRLIETPAPDMIDPTPQELSNFL